MTSARQQTANRVNAALSTGPRSEDGRRRAAVNATRHGLDARLARDELDTAPVDILARLGRTADSLTSDERAAAEALAGAALFRARVQQAEHARLVEIDTGNDPARDGAAATERQIEALLAAFRSEGVDARHLSGFAGAEQRNVEALERLLRYQSRAERRWRQALRQWARASRAPDRAGRAAGAG